MAEEKFNETSPQMSSNGACNDFYETIAGSSETLCSCGVAKRWHGHQPVQPVQPVQTTWGFTGSSPLEFVCSGASSSTSNAGSRRLKHWMSSGVSNRYTGNCLFSLLSVFSPTDSEVVPPLLECSGSAAGGTGQKPASGSTSGTSPLPSQSSGSFTPGNEVSEGSSSSDPSRSPTKPHSTSETPNPHLVLPERTKLDISAIEGEFHTPIFRAKRANDTPPVTFFSLATDGMNPCQAKRLKDAERGRDDLHRALDDGWRATQTDKTTRQRIKDAERSSDDLRRALDDGWRATQTDKTTRQRLKDAERGGDDLRRALDDGWRATQTDKTTRLAKDL